MTFNGLWFLIGVAAAIVVMALVQGVIDHVAGPDPDLRGEPWHPDADHLYRAAPVEPRRDERGIVWPREISESELRLLDGNR